MYFSKKITKKSHKSKFTINLLSGGNMVMNERWGALKIPDSLIPEPNARQKSGIYSYF